MFSLRRPRLLADYVPWRYPISDHAMLLDGGHLLAVFALDGLACETLHDDQIAHAHVQRNDLIRNIAFDGLTLTAYECRATADPADYLHKGTGFRSGYAEALDLAYREQLYDGLLYSNPLFLAVQVGPARPFGDFVGSRVERRQAKADAEETPDERLRRLDTICDQIAASLAAYRPRRLGIRRRQSPGLQGERLGPRFNEMAEAIIFAATGVWRPCPISLGRTGGAMFGERLVFRHETLDIHGPGWTQFAAMLGMGGYPAEFWPGMFSRLRAAPYRYTTVHSFRCLSLAAGHDVLTRKQNKMVYAGDKAFEQLAELAQAANDLSAGKFVMGDHAATMLVFGDTPRALHAAVSEASRDLANGGVRVARETLGNEAAWASVIPGNSHLRVRPGAISSRAYCAFAPFHGQPSGERQGFWGEPVALFRTVTGEPYRFHLHVAGLGNVFVSGMSRSGKTVWLNFLVSQLERSGAQVQFWDKDRGAELAIRAMGGTYLRLRNGEPTVAPLKAFDGSDMADMVFLRRLLHGCASSGGGRPLTAEEDRRLDIGLRGVMELPPEDRWLSDVVAALPHQAEPDSAAARLRRWEWGRELGWVLDGPRHLVSLSAPLMGFDQTAILDNSEASGPVMATIFHQSDKLLDGRRFVTVIDEGWRSLLVPAFADLINDSLKTRGKKNAPVIFGTQSPRDALASPIGHTIREQCPGTVAFANPRATLEDYGPAGMGYTEAEVDIIRRLPMGSGLFLYKRGAESVVLQLHLQGLDDDIAVLSGREETVRLLEQMGEATLADPARLLTAFHAARKAPARELVTP